MLSSPKDNKTQNILLMKRQLLSIIACLFAVIGMQAQENLLSNPGFEDWNGSKPTDWATLSTSNATVEQSASSHSGSYAVVVKGATSNKRFASKSYTLAAGEYTFKAWVCANGSDAGYYRLGYVKLSNGTVADSQKDYIYSDDAAAPVSSNWKEVSYTFTLDAETELALIIMNNKSGKGASFLVDDTSLTTKSGSIVGGGDDNGGNDGEKPAGGEYINETFATSFGVFTPVETIGNYPWTIDYSTAKATSYVGGNNVATSWLISPVVDFTNETEANVTFQYIIRYSESGKVAENHQLLISSDYSGDAVAATWTELPYKAVEGKDWNTFYDAAVNVPAEFMGKKVTFALRYTATTKAGTWEVKNFKVSKGKIDTDEPEAPAETIRCTVAEAIEAMAAGKTGPAIVTGFIVGAIDGKAIDSGCIFSDTTAVATNLLLADDADETDYTKCIPVQLPSGGIRDALNLANNKDHYKKEVILTGNLEKYFGVAGLKSVTAYEFTGRTGIESMVTEKHDGTIYDLTGRRIEMITKAGIYIINGKKVLVK